MTHFPKPNDPEHEELADTVDTAISAPQPLAEDMTPPLPAVPDIPPPVFDHRSGISYFCFSLQGASHMRSGAPCQDRCYSTYVDQGGFLIIAIADGVGSCALSDLGAHIAVHSSVNFLAEQLAQRKGKQPSVKDMGDLLRKAMRSAYDAVEKAAEESQQLLFSLQSTLTVAIYDGNDLFFAHAGDDGIVALNTDGIVQLATTRHKGEEASSVYPLQNIPTWQYGMFANTTAFVMATDGILDCFVGDVYEENRVYYPFIENVISAKADSAQDTKDICQALVDYMQQPEFRKVVTDDLTIAVVTNQKKVHQCLPQFDHAKWDADTKRYNEARYQALYGSTQDPVTLPQSPEEIPAVPAQTGTESPAVPEAPAVIQAPQGNPASPPDAVTSAHPAPPESPAAPPDVGTSEQTTHAAESPPPTVLAAPDAPKKEAGISDWIKKQLSRIAGKTERRKQKRQQEQSRRSAKRPDAQQHSHYLQSRRRKALTDRVFMLFQIAIIIMLIAAVVGFFRLVIYPLLFLRRLRHIFNFFCTIL